MWDNQKLTGLKLLCAVKTLTGWIFTLSIAAVRYHHMNYSIITMNNEMDEIIIHITPETSMF
jgi:hypothetical protein